MKKYFLITLVFITQLFSEDLTFFMDYANFLRPDGIIDTELYFSVPRKILTYDESLTAEFSIEVKVLKDGELIGYDKWGQRDTVKSEKDIMSFTEIPSMTTLKLIPGVYNFKAIVTDLKSGKSGEINIPQNTGMFKVEEFEGFSLSNIRLCNQIEQSDDKESMFYRSGLIIIPNPRKLFGTHAPFLNYYLEVYGLNGDKDKNFLISWRIKDETEKIVKEGNQEKNFKVSGTIALVNRIPVHNLVTGSYIFEIAVKNPETEEIKTSSTMFKIYRGVDFIQTLKEKTDDIENAIHMLNDSQVQKEFDQLYSILPEREKNIMEKMPDVDGRRNYLINYWQEREIGVPGIRQQFIYYVSLANNSFRETGKDGWETDRGRIMLKYGEPNDREVSTFARDAKDHEVWHYYNNNYKFIFADLHDLGVFKLIHSDAPDEIHNEDWLEKVKKSNERN